MLDYGMLHYDVVIIVDPITSYYIIGAARAVGRHLGDRKGG